MSVNVHVIRCDGPPVVAPTLEGQHWIDTLTGNMWFANGTATVANWVLLTADTDVKVKVSATDTTPGFLNSELTVSNGTNTTSPLEKSITSPGADEKLNIQFDQAKLTFGTPVTQNPDQANTEGVSNDIARKDHIHNVPTDVPVTQNPDQANAEGTSTSFARADHIHNIPADAPTTTLTPATTNLEGTGTSFARNDHTHAIATALVGDLSSIEPDDAAIAGVLNNYARGDHQHAILADVAVDIGTTNAEGTSTSFSRADHAHRGVRSVKQNAGTQRFGDLSLQNGTGISVTDDGAGNFTIAASGSALTDEKVKVSATDTTPGYLNTKLLAGFGTSLTLENGAGNEDLKVAVLTGTPVTQNPDIANAPGSATTLAKADHIHNIPAAVAVDVGAANAKGSSTSFSLADHVHKGVHSIARSAVDTVQVFGDVTLEEGTGITIVRASNKFTIAAAAAGLKTKAGTVTAGSFAGSPKKFTVTFATAFPSTAYAINITGTDNRNFTWESKLAGSFVINTNANGVLTGNVDWSAIATGETA